MGEPKMWWPNIRYCINIVALVGFAPSVVEDGPAWGR